MKRLEREREKIMERMRRFRCSELESKVQRWEKCVISLPTAWFWKRQMPVTLSVSRTGWCEAKRKAVSWIFPQHSRYVGTLTRNLFIRVPTLSDTPWSYLVLGLIRLLFYPFLEMESTQTSPTTALLKGLVLWFENCCNQQ